MEPVLYFLLTNVFLFYGDYARDPIHTVWAEGRTAAYNYECERLTQAEAHERYPGRVPPPHPRGDAIFTIDTLVCRHNVVDEGKRAARDELIMQSLSSDVAELAGLAAQQAGEDTVWVVDAFYPNFEVVRKVATAGRMTLAERGRKVTDQAPLLSAGDAEVFRTLPVKEGIELACRRLHDDGSLDGGPLGDDVAWLALALLHPKESQLHAGVCRAGRLTWLR